MFIRLQELTLRVGSSLYSKQTRNVSNKISPLNTRQFDSTCINHSRRKQITRYHLRGIMRCIQFRCTVFQVPIHPSIHRIESSLPKTSVTTQCLKPLKHPNRLPFPGTMRSDRKLQSGPSQYEQNLAPPR